MRYVRVVRATPLSQLFFSIDGTIGNQSNMARQTDDIDRRLLVKPLASGIKPRDCDIDLQDINIY